MTELDTKIAVTNGKGRTIVKVSASGDWLKKHRVDDADEGRAVMSEHAYKLLSLKALMGQERIEAAEMRFGVKAPGGAIPLVPGTAAVSADTFCCICNEAGECACVPC